MSSQTRSSQKVFLEVFLTHPHYFITFLFFGFRQLFETLPFTLFCHCQQWHSDDRSGFQFYWALFLPFLQKLLISSSWIFSVSMTCKGRLSWCSNFRSFDILCIGWCGVHEKQKDIIPEPIKPGGVHPKLGRQVDSQRESAVHGVVKKSPTEREEKLFSSRRQYLTTLSMNAICANFEHIGVMHSLLLDWIVPLSHNLGPEWHI